VDTIHFIVDYSTDFIATGGVLYGFFIVFIECFISALPLSAFIALNVNAFGLYIGVLISWIATTLGSFLCYLFFYYLGDKLSKKVFNKKMLKIGIDSFYSISLTKLVLIFTLPFTPASFINVLAGLSRISKEKFLIALIIGKAFSTIFWGYIGKSILSSLTNWRSLLYILITLIMAYVISKVVGHKMNIV